MPIKITATDGLPVTLRDASPADVEIVYTWQCHPDTRRFARDPRVPTADEHRIWFASRLRVSDCILSIVLHGLEPAGMLRFDRKAGHDADTWEVSIIVAPDKKGRGIGAAALALGRQTMSSAELVAEVLPGNDASHRLFREAGYVLEGDGLYHSRPDRTVADDPVSTDSAG